MRQSEPVLLSFSGGKDSVMALATLESDPAWQVVGLLVTVDQNENLAMHGVPLSLVSVQARALGVPLRIMRVPPNADNPAYRHALEESLEEARMLHPRLSHIAFGDLHLADIRAWREALVRELGWTPLFPLWGADTATLARRVVNEGWKARLVCVDSQQLDARFLGRDFDAALLAELPPSCDPCGEHGEFHTFAYDGPAFDHPVAFTQTPPGPDEGRFRRIDLAPDPS
ncbi:MAG TPA: ATP-binding protein [Xanthomonadaceae bacterium]|nr:ATP-binding protein [Xanthomonadaceae bacterium]